MVKNAKNIRRNNKQVIGGGLYQHTTLGATYETRNMGTQHRPHWTIEDDKGETIGVSAAAYNDLFQPIYVDAPARPEDGENVNDFRAKYDGCGTGLNHLLSLPD